MSGLLTVRVMVAMLIHLCPHPLFLGTWGGGTRLPLASFLVSASSVFVTCIILALRGIAVFCLSRCGEVGPGTHPLKYLRSDVPGFSVTLPILGLLNLAQLARKKLCGSPVGCVSLFLAPLCLSPCLGLTPDLKQDGH